MNENTRPAATAAESNADHATLMAKVAGFSPEQIRKSQAKLLNERVDLLMSDGRAGDYRTALRMAKAELGLRELP